MLVQHFLEASADRLPQKTALVCDGERFTYARLESAANRLAQALVQRGLKRGDRVALFLPNCTDLVIGIFGILKAGGVFVPVNSTVKTDKLTHILTDSGAVFLITSDKLSALLPAGLVGTGALKEILHVPLEAQFASLPDQRPALQTIDLDLACLIYTSGSTGEPKGVMSDHSNVVFASGSIITYVQNREDDIVIGLLPLSFDYGLYQLLMTFRFGGTLVLEKGFTFPASILQRMVEEKVTGLPAVPTMFSLLLKMDLGKYDLSSLRYITNTAAALPPSHIQEIRDKFPGVRLYSMYGLTETKRTLYLPPELLDSRPGSVGVPIPGTECWLEDEDGKRLPPGSTGELVIRGRHVMRGYWQAPELTAKRYRFDPLTGERVCLSGDLFRTDAEGYFYFVSRKDDVIKSRGEKVPPKEVESVLYGMPGLLECAVIGVPDPMLGQAVKAIVVLSDPALTEADVMRFARSHLEDCFIPKYIEIRPDLPKSANGKIDKKALQ